jgi:uronate dehydrogenase
MRETILITGGAGRVAEMISPTLRSIFRLRRLDLRLTQVEGDDEVLAGDVRDVELVKGACDGVAAVLHLAAQPAEADFRARLLPRNIDATWAVFEASVRAGVPRLVFASTIQTISGHSMKAPADAAPRPVSVYACTKLFGEALARFHADTSRLGVACVRVGAVLAADDPALADQQLRSLWCGSEDLGRLVIAAVRSTVPFAIVTAVSPPAADRFDTANPFGWTPIEAPEPGAGRRTS